MDDAELLIRLREVRAKRGYLLPHHGLMAVSAPGLLDAYDAAYTALALDDRALSRHDREFVWLAILIATKESVATHHIPKFVEAGGTDKEIEATLALTAVALGVDAFLFVDRHWRRHLPGIEPRRLYLSALKQAGAGAKPHLVHLAAAAIHTCRAAWTPLEWQIVAAYEDKVPEADLAEALSLTMFPGSVPHFVEAARVWRDLVASRAVQASESFRAWAALSGQGGYDEASGKDHA